MVIFVFIIQYFMIFIFYDILYNISWYLHFAISYDLHTDEVTCKMIFAYYFETFVFWFRKGERIIKN